MTSHSNQLERRPGFQAAQFIACLLLAIYLVPVLAAEVKPGASLGAKTSETPLWFKESFLDFEDDIAEASNSGRRVLLYFHQDGCPYCAKMVEESFKNPQIEQYMRQHFDGISINMWGDRDVISVGGRAFSEKTFAKSDRSSLLKSPESQS